MTVLLVDLFCGAGGFSEVFRTGHGKCVLAIDCWEDALLVHKMNHPECVHTNLKLGGDIQHVYKLIRK